MEFHEAQRLFATARDPFAGKPIANNTRLIRLNENTYAIRLHATNVLCIRRDGSYTLDSGGYETMTTKDRLNAFTPQGINVYQRRGDWFLQIRSSTGATRDYPFRSGMVVTKSREVLLDFPPVFTYAVPV